MSNPCSAQGGGRHHAWHEGRVQGVGGAQVQGCTGVHGSAIGVHPTLGKTKTARITNKKNGKPAGATTATGTATPKKALKNGTKFRGGWFAPVTTMGMRRAQKTPTERGGAGMDVQKKDREYGNTYHVQGRVLSSDALRHGFVQGTTVYTTAQTEDCFCKRSPIFPALMTSRH